MSDKEIEVQTDEKELKSFISEAIAEAMKKPEVKPEVKAEVKEESKGVTAEQVKSMIEEVLTKTVSESKIKFSANVIKEKGEGKQSFAEVLQAVKTNNSYLIKKYDMKRSLPTADEKVLVEGNPALGGFLVPPQYSTQIIDLVNSYSVIRPLCTSIPMSSNLIYFPVVDGGGSAYFINENAPKTPSDLHFSQLPIRAYALAMLIKVTDELLADSNPAVDTILMNMFAKTIANREDLAFLAGTGGAGDPIVGLINSGIGNVPSGVALDFDDVFNAIGGVLRFNGQDIDCVFNAREYATLRTLKGADGQYLWDNVPNGKYNGTIDGRPVYWDGNIPTNLGAGGNESFGIVGDFNYAYIGDREGLVITNGLDADDFSNDRSSFRAVKRVGFAVADTTKFNQISGILP